jgi:hypothetical protein
MILLDHVISDAEIFAFQKYFQTNFDKKYINWQIGDQIIDERLVIDRKSPEFDIVRRIVANNFVDQIEIWSAYQRQSHPHNIHIDDFAADYVLDNRDYFRYTYILAMETIPEFKAIIWKETCWNNQDLGEFAQQWGRDKDQKEKTSNISETQDIEHTFDDNQQCYMADYLTLDGIYTYKTGTACLFDATQLHCTSNWVKYKKFPYRDLLQIHVLTSTPLADIGL